MLLVPKIRALVLWLKKRSLHQALLIFVFSTFAALAVAAPFGRAGWKHIPSDFRIPLLGFFANLLLLAVTWAYVLITRDQLKELQLTHEPKAVIQIRVPDLGKEDVNYGRGNGLYRDGSPIYLDVWNVSAPTIMVTQITTEANKFPKKNHLSPQVFVESGKVASINVAYQIMPLISHSKSLLDLQTGETIVEADFTVEYFSLAGLLSVHAHCRLLFFVSDKHIAITVEKELS